jgi:hypothetical protein
MPDKTERELKRKFGAYLKVAILNARKEYLIEQNKIIKTEISLDEFEFIKDENAEHMLENVACIDYKIKDGEALHARDVLCRDHPDSAACDIGGDRCPGRKSFLFSYPAVFISCKTACVDRAKQSVPFKEKPPYSEAAEKTL